MLNTIGTKDTEYALGNTSSEKATALAILLSGGKIASMLSKTLRKNGVPSQDIDNVLANTSELLLDQPEKTDKLPAHASEDEVLRFLTVCTRFCALHYIQREYGRRGSARERARPVSIIGDDIVDESLPSPENVAMLKEFSVDLTEAIAQLSATQQQHIRRRFYEGISYREIATINGTTVGAVSSGLGKAKKRLRELLASHS